MRRTAHHAKPNMTRAQNKTAFVVWMAGVADHALHAADPQSIGRSYGLDPAFVAEEIRKKISRIEVERRMKGIGQ